MELFNILKSLTLDELKQVKKISNELIKEKSKKPTKTRSEKIQIVRDKINNNATEYNYHELLYAFEIFCNDAGYVVTVNLRNDIVFLTKLFPKRSTPFGEYELAILKKYVDVYGKMYKTSDFPYPSIRGLGQSWIATKIVDLVNIDMKNKQVMEIDDETF